MYLTYISFYTYQLPCPIFTWPPFARIQCPALPPSFHKLSLLSSLPFPLTSWLHHLVCWCSPPLLGDVFLTRFSTHQISWDDRPYWLSEEIKAAWWSMTGLGKMRWAQCVLVCRGGGRSGMNSNGRIVEACGGDCNGNEGYERKEHVMWKKRNRTGRFWKR